MPVRDKERNLSCFSFPGGSYYWGSTSYHVYSFLPPLAMISELDAKSIYFSLTLLKKKKKKKVLREVHINIKFVTLK